MKNSNRKITAILFSLSFMLTMFFDLYILLAMSVTAPTFVLFELGVLVLLGVGVWHSWQSEEPFTCKEKRSYVTLYAMALVFNLFTITMQQQLSIMALSTVAPAFSQNAAVVWLFFGLKLLLPLAAILLGLRTKGTATVVFEEAAEPEALETQEAIEELTEKLDEAEEEA